LGPVRGRDWHELSEEGTHAETAWLSRMRIVQKVVAYIVRDGRVVVLPHADDPDIDDSGSQWLLRGGCLTTAWQRGLVCRRPHARR
jgi:hypothetical protein